MTLISELPSIVFQFENLPQIVVVLVAVLAGLISRRIWRVILSGKGESSQGFRRIAIRTGERLFWPLTVLITLYLGRLILGWLEQPSQSVRLLMPLVGAFAGIRFAVYLLRKGVSGGPLLKASENFIAGFIWIIAGLYLLGLLPEALAMLDSVGTNIGNFRLSLLSGLKLFFLIVLALTIANAISNTLEHKLIGAKNINASTRVGLAKFVKFALITIAVVMVLSSVGVDMSTFAVFGGALGVGLGFGYSVSQPTLSVASS